MSFASLPLGPDVIIRINVPANLLSTSEFEAQLPEAMVEAGLEARNFWETIAGQRLNTSRKKYQESIGMNQKGGGKVDLVLTGDFATMIELGAPTYSLKPGYLASKKIKNGPVKIPRAVAASLVKTGLPTAKKWMVIPIDGKFRTFTDAQSGWIHPGFNGMNMRADVMIELRDKILPEKISDLIDKVYSI